MERLVVLGVRGLPPTAPGSDASGDGRPPGAGSLATTPKADAPGPGNTGLIPAGNLAGLPAIFFPCGFGSDGLPVGLQIVGPAFSEPLLVAIVSAYQRATGHHLRRPKDPPAPGGRGPNRPKGSRRGRRRPRGRADRPSPARARTGRAR